MAELVWEGKYDANGKRVGPVRVALPFQTVEMVNESSQERDRNLFEESTEWRNRLIWGDKKYVLPSLLPEFAGKVDLIYIDPPFNTGGDFSFTATVPAHVNDGKDSDDGSRSITFTKLPSAIEMKAYRDTWGRNIDSYLKWFSETVTLLHELLTENGSLYVHLDSNIGHYAKCVLDDVFGPERFRNEIVWKRTTAHSNAKQGRQLYGAIHDVIFLYTKSDKWKWNETAVSYDEEYERERFKHLEPDGRRFKDADLTAAKGGGDTSYDWRVKRVKGKRWESDLNGEHLKPKKGWDYLGVRPPDGRYWAYSRENLTAFAAQDRLYYTANGTPRLKQYFEEMPGVSLQSIWADIPPVNSQAGERAGYPTQKPEALLERIIKTSSNEGDLVLDCFCGSGTTAAVAEKLGRRWITCDLGRFAVHTARKRLLAIPGVRPFEVQNLGRYERSAWQAAEFGEGYAARLEAYHRFIMTLFRGEYRAGNAYLHGSRKGRLVHVGAVDAPVTLADIRAVAAEARKLVGSGAGAPTELGIDVLFWDLAFEVNEAAVQIAKSAGVGLRAYKIPNEVMEKKAVDAGDIQFHELAALGVAASAKGRTAKVEITEFLMPDDYIPQEVKASVTHWSQWIDYWAVDWDAKGDAFHNQWQAYRTKKEPRLALSAEHHYDAPGEYRAMVKVIDLLGNDTTKALKVVVK